MNKILQFKARTPAQKLERGQKIVDDHAQKIKLRAKSMASGVRIAAGTIVENIDKLTTNEANEVLRHIEKFHKEILAVEALVLRLDSPDDDGPPPKRAA